jgi:hypothetical protein
MVDRLRETLPRLSPELDIESQARAVLRLVFDHPQVERTPIPPDAKACPNCDRPASSTRTPYCGDACKEQAGFVRQTRAGLSLGWILELDKQVALGQNLWDILGGGRPLRREIAPKRSLDVAMKREGGVCQGCGAPATTIDHVGSGCNRPMNLRAVCDDCCLDRPFGDPRVTQSEGFETLLSDLSSRILSPTAIRCCDDPESWDWRAYMKGR